MTLKSVNVIGLGYIGLPTAALLAEAGYSVIGTDVDESVVKVINSGNAHIYEPGLNDAVSTAVASGKLKATTRPRKSDVYIICVPTPIKQTTPMPIPDTDFVFAAVRNIAPIIKQGDLIILESTSPVGTTEGVYEILSKTGLNLNEVHVVYCPERVLPGRTMVELLQNDRVVGGLTENATKVAVEFYKTIIKGSILETNAKTAEMCKLVENSFRDVNIAFSNELSIICDYENINVWDLIRLANHHPRVDIMDPGPGVGGHCIPIDPWFIAARHPENTRLIYSARNVNDQKPVWVKNKILDAVKIFSSNFNNKPKIACLGLSFKPDIDDLRGSPSEKVAISLQSEGFDVMVVEPNIKLHKSLLLVELEYAIAHADLITVLVGHYQFREPVVRQKLISKGALDFCGILNLI